MFVRLWSERTGAVWACSFNLRQGKRCAFVQDRKRSCGSAGISRIRKKLAMQQMLLMKLQDEGCHVDTFLENQEGALVSRDKDSIPYTAQIWFDGRECDTKSEADILKSARILAEIHRKMQLPLEKDYTGRDLKDEYIRHNQELRKIRRFIRKKGASNPSKKITSRVWNGSWKRRRGSFHA